MLDQVSGTVSDLARATPFWDAVMAALGVPCVVRHDTMVGYGLQNRPEDDGHTYLSVRVSMGSRVADNRHWCFRAPNRAAVDAFHKAGLAASGRCDGAPGLQPDCHLILLRRIPVRPRQQPRRGCLSSSRGRRVGLSWVVPIAVSAGVL